MPQEQTIHTSSSIWELSHNYHQQAIPTKNLTYRLSEGPSVCYLQCLSPSDLSTCVVRPHKYGPGCWNPTVSCKLTGGNFQTVSMGVWSIAGSSDWKGSHTMSEIFIGTNSSKSGQERALIGFGAPWDTWGKCMWDFFTPPTAELPYVLSILAHGGWQWWNHWDAGPGQPVKLTTEIQKIIGAGSTKRKGFVEYKDQIIILLSPEH